MAADGFSLSKSDLLPASHKEASRAETLGGFLINSVHNSLSSDAALSSDELKARTQHSEQLAHVAADTIAMLPGLRASVAGLVRATALLELSGDASAKAWSFARDFAQGVAFNKVSASCLPDGVIGQRVVQRFGGGLLGETAGFALAGSGISLVSSGFRSQTWLDEEKNFSLTHGASEMFKAGTLGALLGVPGGLLASRISKAGLAWGAEGRISHGSALAISGLGAGYFSGAVLGGLQSGMNGGDLKTVLDGMGEGGLAGALSGSIGLAAMARLQIAKSSAGSGNLESESQVFAKKASVEKEPLESTRVTSGPKKLDLELWKSLEIKSEKLNDTETSLRDRVEKLGAGWISNMRYHVTGENAEAVAAASKSFAEFDRNGGMRLLEEQVRTYALNGGTITIPEGYVRKLDEVLALRLKATESTNIYTKGPEHAREVLQAQADLEAHPLKNRAHPADFVHLLEELPDRTLVKDLFIREDRAPSDAWNAKDYEKGFRAAATAGQEDRRITFYAQNRSPLLRDYLKHEWGHLLKWAASSESSRFDEAAILEKDGYHVSKYSRRNNDENWAEHAASLLDPDPDKFLETAHSAPLRTVEIGRALMKALVAVPQSMAGTQQSEIANRIAYIQNHILPEAQATLVEHLQGANTDNAVKAAGLIYKLAGEKEFNLLSDIAKTNANPELREAAFTAGWSKVLQGRTTLAGYDREAVTPSAGEMRRFLVDQATSGNKSRSMALDLLSKLDDSPSRFYYDLLTIDSFSKGSKMSRALDLMDRAPDTAALRKAWQEALKSAGENKDERVNLALRALDRHPRLISEVVDILASEAQPRTRPFLRDLKSHYNSDIAQRAANGLRKIDLETRLDNLSKSLSSGDAKERIAAAQSLAASKDPKAVGALMQAYLSAATEAERSAIANSVKQYISPQIWKFEMRLLKAKSPEHTAKLEQFARRAG